MSSTLLRWAPPTCVARAHAVLPPHDERPHARPISLSRSVISKAKAASTGKSANSQVEDLLDAVVAPRTYAKDDGSQFLQRISSEPATKTDIVRLQESLDQLLQQRQARETGICPVREALYSEAFDEVIRQVAVNAAERGVLLLRVRDEIRMVVKAYQALYESSIAFGMRKTLMAEQKRGELQAKVRRGRRRLVLRRNGRYSHAPRTTTPVRTRAPRRSSSRRRRSRSSRARSSR